METKQFFSKLIFLSDQNEVDIFFVGKYPSRFIQAFFCKNFEVYTFPSFCVTKAQSVWPFWGLHAVRFTV